MRLKGKVAVVTGASRGMGRAIALALAREGAAVTVNYSTAADSKLAKGLAAQAVREQIEALGVRCLLSDSDLADEASSRRLVQDTVEHFGAVDVVICNAGICPMVDFLDLSMEVFDRTHAVNLRGHFALCQEAARFMVRRKGGGRFIAVSSVSARVGGAQQAHYCPTKSGLHSLMQCMAVALGPHGITCNSIGPGEVDTDMNRVIPGYETFWNELNRRLPLRRVAQPEDVAGPVVFLASDDAQYITGQLLMIDGGLLSTVLCG